MARCSLADGRCGRLGAPCRSGQCVARTDPPAARAPLARQARAVLRRGRGRRGGCDRAAGRAAARRARTSRRGCSPRSRPRRIRRGSSASTAAPTCRPGRSAPATLALWQLADPGNVGTLIRTADAFGAAVVLSDGCADPDVAEGAARERRFDLARAARGLGRRVGGSRVALEAHGGESLASADARRPRDVPARRRARRAAGRGGARRRRRRSRSPVPSR